MKLFATIIAAMGPAEIIGIVVLGLLLVLLFIYPSLTSKKRQKQITELYKSVDVGDRIKTVGGIIGTVVQINEIGVMENEIVLETGIGDNKTTMVFDMQAVYQNLTKMAQRPTTSEPSVAEEPQSQEQPKDDQEN